MYYVIFVGKEPHFMVVTEEDFHSWNVLSICFITAVFASFFYDNINNHKKVLCPAGVILLQLDKWVKADDLK